MLCVCMKKCRHSFAIPHFTYKSQKLSKCIAHLCLSSSISISPNMLKEIETLFPNFASMIYGHGRSERSVEREKASVLWLSSLFFILFLLVHGKSTESVAS